jgi:hypothetical protein
MTGNLPALAAMAGDDNENGAAASAHSSAERAKKAKDFIDSTSGNRVNGRQGGKA